MHRQALQRTNPRSLENTRSAPPLVHRGSLCKMAAFATDKPREALQDKKTAGGRVLQRARARSANPRACLSPYIILHVSLQRACNIFYPKESVWARRRVPGESAKGGGRGARPFIGRPTRVFFRSPDSEEANALPRPLPATL